MAKEVPKLARAYCFSENSGEQGEHFVNQLL